MFVGVAALTPCSPLPSPLSPSPLQLGFAVHGALHTAMSLSTSEFDKCKITLPDDVDPHTGLHARTGAMMQPANVTCSIKELRHFLAFANSPATGCHELVIMYSGPGQPILFSTLGKQEQHLQQLQQ